ncbi:TORC1 signaling positive regulator [Malassezia pachydermatis]
MHRSEAPTAPKPEPSISASIHASLQMDMARSMSPFSPTNSVGRNSSMLASHMLGSDTSVMRLTNMSLPSQPTQSSSAVEYFLDAHTRAITDLNWSPFHPSILASCSLDTWTRVWDLRMGPHHSQRPAQAYSAWNAGMTQVKWNRLTEHRIAATCDNKVLVWDDRFGAVPFATLETHHSKVYGLAWHWETEHGGDEMLTCSLDGTIKAWDLSSDTSRSALANHARITQPEYTIDTPQPVWRARYLPFGQGIMSVAQRGDAAPCIYRSGESTPWHRFQGHTDVVKEFLFRSEGNPDATFDDRRFQLLTWSQDQTLRLWPLSDELLRSAGFVRGAPAPAPSSGPTYETPLPVNALRAEPSYSTSAKALGHSPSSNSVDEASLPGSFEKPGSLHSLPLSSSDEANVQGAMPRSLPAPRVLMPRPSPRRRRAPPTEVGAKHGPQMRYTQDDATTATIDAVQWMAQVRVGHTAPASDGDVSMTDSVKSIGRHVDTSVLPQEMLHVSYAYPYVLESVDIARRRCTVAVSGPWHDQGAGALAYLRVMFTFPTAYPHEPPAIEIERNASIPFKTRVDLYRSLVDLIEEKAAHHALCLEACVDFLLHGSQVLEEQASEPATAPEPIQPIHDTMFAKSYHAVADAVLQLALRSDMANTALADSDVVQLLSTNVLNRAHYGHTTSSLDRS